MPLKSLQDGLLVCQSLNSLICLSEPAGRTLNAAERPFEASWEVHLGARRGGTEKKERTERYQYVVVPYVIVPYGAAAQKDDIDKKAPTP